MSETGDTNASLLSNPVPSPLIDRDEPADATPKADVKAKPATAAEVKKTATPDATDENAETKSASTADATDAADTTAEPNAEDETRKQSRRQRKLQIERDARIRAETRAEMAEKALAEARQKPAAQDASEPKREDFETYELYLEERAAWRADQAVTKRLDTERDANQKRALDAKTQEGHRKQADDWIKREQEFTVKVPTFEEDVTPFVDGELQQFSKDARQLIVELGPEVLHHLAMDENLVDDILKMSPLRQIAAIGRIDVTAASQKDAGAEVPDPEDEPETPAPRRAAPPAPAKHVRHGTSAPSALSDDQATYMEQRKKQGARWAR